MNGILHSVYNATIKCAICFRPQLFPTPWLVCVKLISTSVSMTAGHQFWWENSCVFKSFLSWENGIIFPKAVLHENEGGRNEAMKQMNFVNNFYNSTEGRRIGGTESEGWNTAFFGWPTILMVWWQWQAPLNCCLAE